RVLISAVSVLCCFGLGQLELYGSHHCRFCLVLCRCTGSIRCCGAVNVDLGLFGEAASLGSLGPFEFLFWCGSVLVGYLSGGVLSESSIDCSLFGLIFCGWSGLFFGKFVGGFDFHPFTLLVQWSVVFSL
ncbi:hypothetical protein A2U01_0016400, partial [Trifolium medium]|nr:hypothetical protein [Trifolium medium]